MERSCMMLPGMGWGRDILRWLRLPLWPCSPKKSSSHRHTRASRWRDTRATLLAWVSPAHTGPPEEGVSQEWEVGEKGQVHTPRGMLLLFWAAASS